MFLAYVGLCWPMLAYVGLGASIFGVGTSSSSSASTSIGTGTSTSISTSTSASFIGGIN
jgi:hypothetical protein